MSIYTKFHNHLNIFFLLVYSVQNRQQCKWYQQSMNQQQYSNQRLNTSPSSQFYSDSKPRFQRKSPQSSKSNSSRSSQESPIHQKFIKINKISKLKLDPDEFFQGFSQEFVKTETEQDQNSIKKYSRSKQNNIIKIKNLQKELSKRLQQVQESRNQISRLKQAIEKQIDKRKNAEKMLKNNISISSELQKKCRQLQFANNQFSKQIKFWEERNYSKQEKIINNYREKGLMQQVKRLKGILNGSNNTAVHFLSSQIARLQEQNTLLKQQNEHINISQRTIISRLVHFQKQLRHALQLEQQFRILHEKYEKIVRKQRIVSKELEQLKKISIKQMQKREESPTYEDILTYSSSSNNSIVKKTRVLAFSHRRMNNSSRGPNGS